MSPVHPSQRSEEGGLPAEIQDRKEGLAVVVATRNGKYREYLLFTQTLLGKISFDNTQIVERTPYYLAPVFQV
jgi:hypothetical protein